VLPFDAEADQVTVADALPLTAETPEGAPGTPKGTTVAEGPDAALVPASLAAVTVKL
jgi:hypothetical protein